MGTSDDRYLSIHLARVDEVTPLDSKAAIPPGGEPSCWLLGADATETWSAAFRPARSHGSCNWLDGGHFDADGARADGPIAVMTSAGWDVGPDVQVERAIDFGAAVARVRAAMWSEPHDGMTSHQSFVFPGMLVHGGITFTTWRDEAAAVTFAYRPGAHMTEMDRFRLDETADRTSFTRLRPIETHGTWHGADPLAAS